MNCSALSVSSERVQVASDFKARGLCIFSCKNDVSKVLQVRNRQRVVSSGLSSEHCGSSGYTVPPSIFTSHKHEAYGGRAKSLVANALPMEAVSAAAAIVIVSASVSALIWLNQGKSNGQVVEKEICEACKGSGLCSSCNGEGFQLKSLSREAAARARANAKDAATRYTAGLANKWSYCTNCSGSRNCPACSGRGSLNITETES
eukprot:c17902_g1_i1 orf=414-1025(-)